MNHLEVEKIVDEVTKRIFLKLPEIIGNLIEHYSAKAKISKEFYEKFPEFNNHRNIVAAVIERLERTHPGEDIEKLIYRSVDEIRSAVLSAKSLNMNSVTRPNTNISYGHGDI